MNRILLRLSKTTDLDLYAYFSHVEYRKSTLVKQLLRDYIRKESTVRIRPLHITYDSFTDPDMPKILTISIQLNEQDKDITDYFSDCPNGYRSKCMKSILRIMLAPYTQSAYHREPVESYVPARQYMENENVNPVNPYPNGYPAPAGLMGQFPYPYPYPYPYPMMYGMQYGQAAPQMEQTPPQSMPQAADMTLRVTPAEPVYREESVKENTQASVEIESAMPTIPEEIIPISTPIRDVLASRGTEESVSESVNDSSDDIKIPEWKIPSPANDEIATDETLIQRIKADTISDSDDDSEIDDAMFALLTGENY